MLVSTVHSDEAFLKWIVFISTVLHITVYSDVADTGQVHVMMF